MVWFYAAQLVWLYSAGDIERVLEAGTVGETYNIGGGAEMSNLAVIEAICDEVDAAFAADDGLAARFPDAPAAKGEATDRLKTFVTDRPGHDRRYAIDARRIHDELGFTPTRAFRQGLAETLGWYLARESWWRALLDGSYRQWMATNYEARGSSGV